MIDSGGIRGYGCRQVDRWLSESLAHQPLRDHFKAATGEESDL